MFGALSHLEQQKVAKLQGFLSGKILGLKGEAFQMARMKCHIRVWGMRGRARYENIYNGWQSLTEKDCMSMRSLRLSCKADFYDMNALMPAFYQHLGSSGSRDIGMP